MSNSILKSCEQIATEVAQHQASKHFLPKCAESGNCSTVQAGDVDSAMQECIG